MELKPGAGGERLQPVHDPLPEVDRARVLEIPAARGYLHDPEAEVGCLEEHLGVEAEVERVAEERDVEQELARVGAVAGVHLAEVGAEHAVLDAGEEAVRYPLPARHAARDCRAGLGEPRAAPRGWASREPRTRSAWPARIGLTRSGISVGSYWPSGWSITTASAPRW